MCRTCKLSAITKDRHIAHAECLAERDVRVFWHPLHDHEPLLAGEHPPVLVQRACESRVPFCNPTDKPLFPLGVELRGDCRPAAAIHLQYMAAKKPEHSESEELEPREQVRAALSAFLSPTQLSSLVDEVLATTKTAWVRCDKCQNHVKGSVPDAKAVVSALSELLTQAYGRPGAEPEDRTIVVNRHVYLVAEDDEPLGELEASSVTVEAEP